MLLSGEVIIVYCENHTKLMCMLWGWGGGGGTKHRVFWCRANGTYSSHWIINSEFICNHCFRPTSVSL